MVLSRSWILDNLLNILLRNYDHVLVLRLFLNDLLDDLHWIAILINILHILSRIESLQRIHCIRDCCRGSCCCSSICVEEHISRLVGIVKCRDNCTTCISCSLILIDALFKMVTVLIQSAGECRVLNPLSSAVGDSVESSACVAIYTSVHKVASSLCCAAKAVCNCCIVGRHNSAGSVDQTCSRCCVISVRVIRC